MSNSAVPTQKVTQALCIEEPLAAYQAGKGYMYQADGLGSVVALTKSTGTAANTYFSYNTFGGMPAPTETVANPFPFTGREWDSETSLYYYRARYYDSFFGRFLSEDPIRFLGGVDFYRYVSNSPPNASDPSGLQPGCGCVLAHAAVGAGIGAAIGTVVGGVAGAIGGATAGGAGGTLLEPGGGTVVGAIAGGAEGVAAGSRAGALAGAALGTIAGAIAGEISCSASGRQSRCTPTGYVKELGGCRYICDDGTIWFQSGPCINPLYKPWGEGFPKFPPIPLAP